MIIIREWTTEVRNESQECLLEVKSSWMKRRKSECGRRMGPYRREVGGKLLAAIVLKMANEKERVAG